MPAPPAAVGRHHHLRSRIVDALPQRVGTESAEHDGMRGADPRAGEHGDRQLRNHAEVDRDAISLLHAQAAQRVCKATDFAMEIEISERALVAGLAFPNECGLVAPPSFQMPIETIHSNVELSAQEPFRERVLPFEHLMPLVKPFEGMCLLGPESFEIAPGFIDSGIGDVGRLAKGCRRRKAAIFSQKGGDGGLRHPILLTLACSAFRISA
jgi:hypothetical protein